ncbi:MAG TPA: ABC transporter permease [Chitinophagaceae bacterium]|nr:ABC transporter permease [Chitinophagaceae bacterium]
MFTAYFKTTIRNLWRNKSNSFLNIFGLAIGITCAGLIFLWVEDEVNFDTVHKKIDRLYFVRTNQKYEASTFTHWSTPGVLAPAMQQEIPGVANTCRTTEGNTTLLFNVGDKAMYAAGKYVEPSLFSMFTLPFVQGNKESAFAQLHSIVITENAAKKFFGNDKNVIGKSIRVDNKQDYVVTGVLKDIPANSSLQFEWVAPFQIWFQQSPWAHVWGNQSISTYVELKPGISPASIDKQLYNYVQKREPSSTARPFLFSMKDWRLYDEFVNGKKTGGGRIETVRMFSIIAWIIILIACINFMNLATARSEKRSREVGVRKVLGAGKKSLVLRFMGEAILMAMLASLLAVIVMTLILPFFNSLVQKNLQLGLTDPFHILILLLLTFVCGIVAGSYPSLYLSSFNPVFVLKGIQLKSGGAAFVRRGLVVLQFTVSIVLIISTIIIYQQIQHVKSRPLGFDKDNLLQISVQGNMAKNLNAIKQELMNSGEIKSVAESDYSIIYGGNNTDALTWQGKPPGSRVLISTRSVSSEFMATLGMDLQEGRNLLPTDTVDASASGMKMNVVITASFAKLMGNGPIVGKTITADMPDAPVGTVVGVVNDYVYSNMYGKPDPVLFTPISPESASVLYIRLNSQSNTPKALAQIESILKKFNPGYPFDYRFVDEQFNQMFLNEQLVSKLSRVFAALAIIISCLGLFGLAAYTAERRTKEIGIRKVLGATATSVARLLSKEFIRLAFLSCLIAFPVSWWAMNSWLQDFQYRTNIHWWVFAAAGIGAVMITLLTVSFQAIKAAIANPVKSLRTE